jgi:hypothetical protein
LLGELRGKAAGRAVFVYFGARTDIVCFSFFAQLAY